MRISTTFPRERRDDDTNSSPPSVTGKRLTRTCAPSDDAQFSDVPPTLGHTRADNASGDISTQEPQMRICIIGAGLSGLSAAYYLTKTTDADITVLERAPHAGGRAGVRNDTEHCPRVFLDDYTYFFDILRNIPAGDGTTVHDSLHRITRYCHSTREGWVPISHLYRFRSPEIELRDRFQLAASAMTGLLAAETVCGTSTDRYGLLRNYSVSSIVRVAANAARSRQGLALDGPTDTGLIHPWVEYLSRAGVNLRLSTNVERISCHGDGALVRVDGPWHEFDAAILSTHLSDAVQLVDATPSARRAAALDHTRCAATTVTLDPRERVIQRGHVALYSRHGLTALIQPGASRCVALCIRTPSTDMSWVLDTLTEMLDLKYRTCGYRTTSNLLPAQSVHTSEHLRPDRVLANGRPHIYVAGSYLRSRYPIDSAESASRSAFAAVDRLITVHRPELRATARPALNQTANL